MSSKHTAASVSFKIPSVFHVSVGEDELRRPKQYFLAMNFKLAVSGAQYWNGCMNNDRDHKRKELCGWS